MGGITNDLAKISGDPPDFQRDNIAGPHSSRELNANAKNLILVEISTQASCICRKLASGNATSTWALGNAAV